MAGTAHAAGGAALSAASSRRSVCTRFLLRAAQAGCRSPWRGTCARRSSGAGCRAGCMAAGAGRAGAADRGGGGSGGRGGGGAAHRPGRPWGVPLHRLRRSPSPSRGRIKGWPGPSEGKDCVGVAEFSTTPNTLKPSACRPRVPARRHRRAVRPGAGLPAGPGTTPGAGSGRSPACPPRCCGRPRSTGTARHGPSRR